MLKQFKHAGKAATMLLLAACGSVGAKDAPPPRYATAILLKIPAGTSMSSRPVMRRVEPKVTPAPAPAKQLFKKIVHRDPCSDKTEIKYVKAKSPKVPRAEEAQYVEDLGEKTIVIGADISGGAGKDHVVKFMDGGQAHIEGTASLLGRTAGTLLGATGSFMFGLGELNYGNAAAGGLLGTQVIKTINSNNTNSGNRDNVVDSYKGNGNGNNKGNVIGSNNPTTTTSTAYVDRSTKTNIDNSKTAYVDKSITDNSKTTYVDKSITDNSKTTYVDKSITDNSKTANIDASTQNTIINAGKQDNGGGKDNGGCEIDGRTGASNKNAVRPIYLYAAGNGEAALLALKIA